MARVTIQDCLLQVENRFTLCLIASKRAMALNDGAPPRVPVSENKPEKPTVVALREIATGCLPQDGQLG